MRSVFPRGSRLSSRLSTRASSARRLSTHASSCYLPTEWTELPLLTKTAVSHDTDRYDFGLPDKTPLALPVCACILMQTPEGDVRPYTPISDDSQLGSFTLLVKRYAQGKAAQYLHALEPGARVRFKHIAQNVKEQYPFEGKNSISMLCAGTGVTPIYQALRKILTTPGDDREVNVLVGNKSVDDILLLDELTKMADTYADRFNLLHVIGERPDEPYDEDIARRLGAERYESGWIDEEKIQAHCFPRSRHYDSLILVCGLPAMYEALCGPRADKELAPVSVLGRLGYSTEEVAKM